MTYKDIRVIVIP